MTTTHSRAKKGGEFGANGEWYEGGKFIATTTAPKQHKRPSRSTGRQEVEPYRWEVAPVAGMLSIFRRLSGVEIYNRATNTFTFNEALRSYFADPEAIVNRKAAIDAYNRGGAVGVMSKAIEITEPLEPVRFKAGNREFQVWIDERDGLSVLVTGTRVGRMRIEPSSHLTCTIYTENPSR